MVTKLTLKVDAHLHTHTHTHTVINLTHAHLHTSQVGSRIHTYTCTIHSLRRVVGSYQLLVAESLFLVVPLNVVKATVRNLLQTM